VVPSDMSIARVNVMTASSEIGRYGYYGLTVDANMYLLYAYTYRVKTCPDRAESCEAYVWPPRRQGPSEQNR